MRNPSTMELVEVLRRAPRAFTWQAIESRWSRPALRAAVRSGAITRVLPGLYAATEHAVSTLTRSHAATAWVGSGSVVIGAAAASAWGLCEPPRIITVTAPLTMSRHTPQWLKLKRLTELPSSALWHGCPVATPAWAIVTSYGHLRRDQADELVYRAVRRGLVTPPELSELITSLRAVKHRRSLEATIAATAAGSESFLETVGLTTVFTSKDFGGFIRQHQLVTRSVKFRLDMYEPLTRTAVELDGDEHHDGTENRLRDVRRDAILASVGILTLRLTYRDLTTRAPWCRDVVRDTLAMRADPRVGMNADFEADHAREWA